MRKKKILKYRGNEKFLYLFLFFAIVTYTTILSVISIDYYNRFYFSAFDLGIFDQGIWLLSKGEDPFVTVRGLHLFGDHIQFTIVLFAPLFIFCEDTRILLVAQSFILSFGALPLFLIAKRKFEDSLLPMIFVLSYLFYPALHYLNLENFHPVVLAVPSLFFSFYFLEEKKFIPYLISIIFLLLTREELVFTTIALGFYALFFKDKKIGAITVILSLFWMLAIFYVIFPHYVPFPHPNLKRGGDILGRIRAFLLNPMEILTEENQKYILDLMMPVAFLPFFHKSFLLALPALGINLLTTWPYAHSIQYHYTYAIIPFVFISAIYAVANILKIKNKRIRGYLYYLIVVVLSISFIMGNIFIGPRETSIRAINSIFERIVNFNNFSENEKIRYEAISLIPKNATVSATYLFVPHLSHRKIIYMFPNPFKEAYWGAEFGNFTPPTPTKDVDYIILDDTPNEFEREIIYKLIENGSYIKIFEKNNISVLKKS